MHVTHGSLPHACKSVDFIGVIHLELLEILHSTIEIDKPCCLHTDGRQAFAAVPWAGSAASRWILSTLLYDWQNLQIHDNTCVSLLGVEPTVI